MAFQRFHGAVMICVLPLVLAATSQPGAPPVSTQRPPTSESPLTALDRYVHTPDPAYAWREVTSIQGEDATAHLIEMTSQTWLTTNEVNRPVWRHWLTVIRPKQLEHPTALLFIGGGNNNDTRLPRPDGELVRVARETHSVVAQLRMVPNQPLIFGNDQVERVEDDLIAYTWDKFLRTGKEIWLARLPMTKAAVRAMDTITAFCASEAGGGVEVNRFVVAGGSKRGWTTWTTAAVDRRVVAICPIVIDVLNMQDSMLHHFRAYGFWAPAVGDYVHHGIMGWMRTPEMAALAKIEDPYSYRDRLDIPKLIMNACGDQFFLPDSSQFYFSDLKEPKYLRYVPNADHSLKGTDATDTLLAFHDAILRGARFPKVTWEHPRPGQVVVRADKPLEANLWSATATESRDFRLETLGPVWRSTPLQPGDDGEYRAEVSAPEKGWTAYMVELVYDIGGPARLKLTTDVEVVPQTLPFPEPKPDRGSR